MFQEFNKIARLNRACTITEKLDGTNAHVFIEKKCNCGEVVCVCIHDPSVPWLAEYADLGSGLVRVDDGYYAKEMDVYRIAAASRSRFVTPDDDNFGFAKWVQAHAMDLLHLGEGRHYGEWWGPGIQRGYGLREKKFSLFNTARWVSPNTQETVILKEKQTFAPDCCDVVPVLYEGPFDTQVIRTVLDDLHKNGSVASPGFLRPEGIVIFHSASRVLFKVTIEKDEEPKSKSRVAKA